MSSGPSSCLRQPRGADLGQTRQTIGGCQPLSTHNPFELNQFDAPVRALPPTGVRTGLAQR
jgi:hypothetical protein